MHKVPVSGRITLVPRGDLLHTRQASPGLLLNFYTTGTGSSVFATSIHTERNGEVCDGPTVRPAGWDPEGPLSKRTPLLPDQPRPRQAPPKPATTPSKARRRIFVLICISIVAADFGALLSYAPQLEILESLICEDLNLEPGPLQVSARAR